MKRLLTPCVAVVVMMLDTGAAAAQSHVEEHAFPGPTVAVSHLTETLTIDGLLTEAVWQTAQPATDFIQQDPDEGEPATQRTEIRFAMDSEAIYVGARMFDTMGAEGVQTRLTRRDQTSVGDRIELVFDTFHDHAGRTIFWINPSGVKFDAGQAAPNADSSWDPVWTAGTRVDSLGWTAELRIPLSQLRFPRDAEQVWGAQVWRYVERLNEASMWSFWRADESGGPTRFGHLTGIRSPERVRAFEILPYTTARASSRTPTQPGSPFQDQREYGLIFGGDVKALLTSSLTLDATVNPDFGQVEVDPAIVNLSAFETFLPEKRPFFIEGSGLFGFGGGGCNFCSNFSSLSLFYSRRIGRRPQGFLTFPTRYVEVPENSRILGAAKITGRTAGGVQIGLLNAVTGSESAQVITAEGELMTRELEPLTNYMVARVRQILRDGNLHFGGIATSTIRRFGYDPIAEILPARASALGADVAVRFHDETYVFNGSAALSEVSGDPAAILRLQESSARYFNRPDRRGRGNGAFSDALDPSLGSMRGFAGYARLTKEAGIFRWESALNVRSPGFEVNDLAFLTRADYVWMNGNVLGVWTTPTRFFRQADLLTGAQQQFNFDGDRTGAEARISASAELLNYWTLGGFLIYVPELDDDRLTRGGPLVRRPSAWVASANLGTDSRRSISLNINPRYARDSEDGYQAQLSLNVNARPASNVSLSIGPRYSQNRDGSQFVQRFMDPTATHFHGQRIVFADLVQHSISMDTRAAITLSPTLTIETFLQPLLASGEYSAFREFEAPRTVRKRAFDGSQLQAVVEDGREDSYVLDPDRNAGTANYTFNNPDFNLRSLRGNAVVRWEYRPGSTLFFVWQQSRSGTESFGDMNMGRDIGGILDQRPDNVFMVKATYWFGK